VVRELVVISGKGGTGKTSVSASIISLASSTLKLVAADCDVDASTLHVLLKPRVKQEEKFSGSKVARIDKGKCIKCMACQSVCRFDAINDLGVDIYSCEGCGVCAFICPVDAITLEDRDSGRIFVSETKYGPMCHAELLPGESNSGKLVSLVKQYARKIAEDEKRELIVVDGPPGIGCPVISSIAGADLLLIITEPTMSGLHDLRRAINLAQFFRMTKIFVAINMWDINPEMTTEIVKACADEKVEVLAKLPFDKKVVDAVVNRMPAVEFDSTSPFSQEVKQLWDSLFSLLST